MKRPSTPPPPLFGTLRAGTSAALKAFRSDPAVSAGIASVLVFALLLAFRQIYSSDLGFHLAAGRWIIENLSVPRVDMFTTTVAGTQWIDLYWLYQAGQALVDGLGGDSLLILVNAVMILLALVLVSIRTALRDRKAVVFLVPLLLAAVSGMTFETRPHAYSWVFLSLILLVLEAYARDRHRGLVLLPVIMVVWMNTHPVAALGWVAIGCYVAGLWMRDRKADQPLLVWSAVSVLASLLTPYGLAGAALPFQQLGFLQEENVFKRLIGEYRSMFTLEEYRQGGRPFFLQSLFPLHLTVALIAGGVVASIRRLSAPEWLLIVAFGYVGSLAMKNFEYLVVALAPIAAAGYAAAAAPETPAREKRRRGRERGSSAFSHRLALWGRRVAIGVIPIAVLLSISTITNGYYVALRAPYRFGLGVDDHSLPVRAGRFLEQHELKGRLLNDIVSGGYLMDRLPQPVFVDGRNEVYGEDFARSYLTSLTPAGFARMVRKHDPEIAIFTHSRLPQWLRVLAEDPEWRLVYADDLSVVYLRTGYAPQVARLDTSPLDEGVPPLKQESVAQLLGRRWPAGPLWFLQALATPQYFPEPELRHAVLLYQLGFVEAAARTGLAGLAESTLEPTTLYFNLGAFLFELGHLEWAATCYRRVLEDGPDLAAQQRLRQIDERLRSTPPVP